jgi:hypothetical protein
LAGEFNTEPPHEALDTKCPNKLNTNSPRRYDGLPEPAYPFHDRDESSQHAIASIGTRKTSSPVLTGQRLGITENASTARQLHAL